MLTKKQKGKHYEGLACHFLQQKGFLLLEKNFFCYYGEIDLIMQEKEDIIFIEVRSRKKQGFGNALESIDIKKRNKLIKTATYYLQKKKILNKVNSRFDIVTIDFLAEKTEFDWIKNAFWIG